MPYTISLKHRWESGIDKYEWNEKTHFLHVRKIPTKASFVDIITRFTDTMTAKKGQPGITSKFTDKWISGAKLCKSFRGRLGEWQKFDGYRDHLNHTSVAFKIERNDYYPEWWD